MIAGKPSREVQKMLRDAGWVVVRRRGSHTHWTCPTARHSFSLPDGHKSISPGVLRKLQKAMSECKESA
ncbi:type II toxin-antitoxin system HicA family toxin [Flexivirga sp. ID2601S]|uniref:Type II toxin-antitoxin system HicA family toxin n=1 Tax=Flexivirga aerilata TaxID=1656889 RepID=A0A849AG41_9MICO|nr:type II toxin-antitoxin system HicA family toxin [Flexivirga aerilata]